MQLGVGKGGEGGAVVVYVKHLEAASVVCEG